MSKENSNEEMDDQETVDIWDDSEEDVTDVEESEEVAEEVEQEEPKSPGFTPEDFANALRSAIPQPQQQPEKKDLSPEEQAKLLRVFRPDENHVKRLLSEDSTPEQRLEVLQEITGKTVEHAAAIAAQMVAMKFGELEPQVRAAQEVVQQQKKQAVVNTIVSKYPGLKGREQLLDVAVNSLRAQGYQAQNENEAIEKLVGEAERLAKAVDPQFSLKSRPQIASVSTGGRTAGGGKQAKPKKPAWASVFD